MQLLPIVDIILELHNAEIATEQAAIDALVSRRWPNGLVPCPRCSSICDRNGAHFTCPLRGCEHEFTVFVRTALESLRRPRVRAIFLALRAMAISPRGVSALEIARETETPHATMWRHMHRLRALLPGPSSSMPAKEKSAFVRVCGRRVQLEGWASCPSSDGPTPGFVMSDRRSGNHHAKLGEITSHVAVDLYLYGRERGGRGGRMVLESFRTWLNGTFHGVREHKLHLYTREFSARARHKPRALLFETLCTLFRRG